MAALLELAEIECVLVGDAARIQRILEGVAYSPEHIDVVHAGEVIRMKDEPEEAVRRKRDASLLAAMQLATRAVSSLPSASSS